MEAGEEGESVTRRCAVCEYPVVGRLGLCAQCERITRPAPADWSERDAVVAYLLREGFPLISQPLSDIARGLHLTAARAGYLDAYRERVAKLRGTR